jgi:hydrogenase large subunit
MTVRNTPNSFNLNDAGRRVVVDPVTRIEGHMRCEVNIDDDNIIRNAVSSGTMWRGLEVILKGRDPLPGSPGFSKRHHENPHRLRR